MIHIRPIADADFSALMGIMNHVIAEGEAFVLERAFDDQAMRKWIASWEGAWVAQDDSGCIVGAYVFRANQPGRGSHVANAAYLVAPVARGAGVGRALGEHSLVEAKRAGYAAMQFNAVVADNLPAVRLWRSLGFSEIGRIPGGFRGKSGQLTDLIVMHRFLERPGGADVQ